MDSVIGIKNIHRSVLRINTLTVIKIGLELKHDSNKKNRESKIHSTGHRKTRHPKISGAPIYDLITSIRPDSKTPNFERPQFLDLI